ncbi:MAG: polyphenol oxidase family protein, partial [Alphaproteobacteria bacterium]|nr:polyphenol oxidase family protein [Alphaproteobacteria bacterium]
MTEFRSTPAAEALVSPCLAARHFFFSRMGGVSTGAYASLNCSLSSGDEAARVTQNRALGARALGIEPSRLVGLHQVHGAAAVLVREPWGAGAGPRADGMATDQPGLALGIITADCAPVLFVDGEAGVIGAAHAGWRGAVAGVLEATIAVMERLGAERARIAAAIGPSIAQASYEVAADLRDAVLARSATDGRFFAEHRSGRWLFDLAGYCLARLSQSG